jgi:hypothetical protein
LSGNTEASIFHLTVGREYVVHAMAWWRSGVGVLVLTDLGRPGWVHIDLFDVVDARLPGSWRFGVVADPEYVLALCGYEALTADVEHHDLLVYGQRDALRTFLAQRDRTYDSPQDRSILQQLEAKLDGDDRM